MRSLAFILFTCVLAQILPAQQPYFDTREIDIRHSELNATKILQSRNGLIYIGTDRGLYSYDGNEFDQILIHGEKQAEITSFLESHSGLVWMGSANGMIYQLADDSLVAFVSEEGYPKVTITEIAETPDSLIWFATYGEGVYYWDGHRQYNINTDDGLPDNYVYDLVVDQEGNCWGGTDRGLFKCRIEDGKKKLVVFGLEEGLNDLIIISLAMAADGTIWFGTYEHGIGYVHPEKHTIIIPASMKHWEYGPVNTLLPYGQMIWIGTDRHGIVQYDLKYSSVNSWSASQRGIMFPKIRDLLLDEQMNIWGVSYNRLVLSYGQAIEFIPSRSEEDRSPGAVLCDREGNVYLSYGNELWYHESSGSSYSTGRRIKLNNKLNSIISLYEDPHGNIWIGSFGDGIVIYDPVAENELFIDERSGLRNGNILSIDGSRGDVWLATLGGAEHIKIDGMTLNKDHIFRIQHLGEEDGLPNNYIYKVLTGSDGKVWFGTDGNGISVLAEDSINNVFSDTDISDLVVYSITEDNTGIWFSTAKHGIYGLSDSLIHLTVENGLKNYDIRGIAANNSGKLIIVHSEGFSIYDITSGHFSHIENVFGLDNSHINLNALSIYNETICIGVANGFVRIRTGFLPMNMRPETIIKKVSVFLEKQDPKGHISLKHNQNYLSFNYVGLWPASAKEVSYEIKLEGHDRDWISTTDRTVSYANLPPGDYVFMVRSSIDGIFDNISVATYYFTINKPFWSTYWFISLMIVLVILSVYAFMRIREKNLERIKDLEREKLLFEFETLKSQINPHFLFNSFSTLISIIEDDPNVAVDYVQKLSNFFRKILEHRDRELIPLSEELELIRTYVEIQQKRFGNSLRLNINITDEKQQLAVPPLVLQLLIENAIKHNIVSASRPLVIDIFLKQSSTIIVRNILQPKKDRPVSTGLGLNNIRQRYVLLSRKEINVKEEEGYFVVELPAINQSL